MALEETMQSLIAALDRNTEANGGKPAGGKGGTVTKKPVETKVTMEQVKAALNAVKDAHGKPAAVKIIKSEGGAAEMAAIKPARYTAVIAACDELMGEGTTDEAEADDEL